MKKFLMAGAIVLSFFFTIMSIKAPHKIPLLWRIPYTSIETLESDPNAIKALNSLREQCRTRYLILSAYRSPTKNKLVGGVKHSMHTKGIAFDVIVPQSHRADFYECAKDNGFTAYGWGNRAVHIDMGNRRWWTYRDDSKNASGNERYQYLHKAPNNFKKDFGLARR